MTKLTKSLGIALLVGALALPVFVWADGWGRGHHMMGPWGSGPGYHSDYERGYRNLTEEQRTQLEQLDRKFYDETADLRNEIWTKSAELKTLLNSSNPDSEKVRALQKEFSDLRAKLDERRLNYELEARKIRPEPRFGRGYGRGNYGHHMRDFDRSMGYGWHMRGYGPGSCRN
jgi:zinc resistance-associated protein